MRYLHSHNPLITDSHNYVFHNYSGNNCAGDNVHTEAKYKASLPILSVYFLQMFPQIDIPTRIATIIHFDCGIGIDVM